MLNTNILLNRGILGGDTNTINVLRVYYIYT